MKKLFIGLIFVLFIFGCTIKTTEKPTTITAIGQQDNMYMVSHSEYWSGEQGQIIAHLLDYKGQPILANCYTDILYPNKTYFKQNETMTYGNNSYYYIFTTPTTEGVYEYMATCYYDSKSRSVTNSFHLSPALNFVKISYDNLSNQITNLSNLQSAQFGNTTYNLSQIKADTDYIRTNMITNVTTNATFQNEVLAQLVTLTGYCNDTKTDTSYLCQWVNETKLRLLNMNISVDNYLLQINQTTGTTAEAIVQLNQTVSGIAVFTPQDRIMMEKIYNCTILGINCYMNPERVWNYTAGRYTNGEEIS